MIYNIVRTRYSGTQFTIFPYDKNGNPYTLGTGEYFKYEIKDSPFTSSTVYSVEQTDTFFDASATTFANKMYFEILTIHYADAEGEYPADEVELIRGDLDLTDSEFNTNVYEKNDLDAIRTSLEQAQTNIAKDSSSFLTMMSAGFGLVKFTQSNKTYLSTKNTLTNGEPVFELTSTGIRWTDNYNGDSTIWNAGVGTDGKAFFPKLSTFELNASHIKAGVISSTDGNSTFNLGTGDIKIGAEYCRTTISPTDGITTASPLKLYDTIDGNQQGTVKEVISLHQVILGLNPHIDATLFGDGIRVLTIGSDSVSCNELYSDSLSTGNITSNGKSVDYVTEESSVDASTLDTNTTGTWYYRKWNSGRVEVWGYRITINNLTWTEYTATSRASKTITIPLTINTLESATMNTNTATLFSGSTRQPTAKNKLVVNVWKSNDTSATTSCECSFNIIGR